MQSLVFRCWHQAFFAEVTLVVQKAGQGTTVWAEIITKELEKHLGERIVLRLFHRARDIPWCKQVS